MISRFRPSVLRQYPPTQSRPRTRDRRSNPCIGDISVAKDLLGHEDAGTTQFYVGMTTENRTRDAMARRAARRSKMRGLVGVDAPAATPKLVKGRKR
jgi:hypothetical protein